MSLGIKQVSVANGGSDRYLRSNLPYPGVSVPSLLRLGLLTLLAPASLMAQAAPAIPTPAQQIASAVLPLPTDLQAGARVLGYRPGAAFVELRKGSNEMVCLADDPAVPSFHVTCYHADLEPFMARGRALRAEGVEGGDVDTVRFREVQEKKLPMPMGPAALYSLTGPAGSWDPETNETKNVRPLYVVYLAYATEQSTGIPAKPSRGVPWLMFPGTPKAHIMYIP